MTSKRKPLPSGNYKIKYQDSDMESKIPYSKMEPEIVPTVKLLNAHGIKTMSSCEGHLISMPFIICQCCKELTPFMIAHVLHSNGVTGFNITTCHTFNSKKSCLVWYHIDFWNKESLIKEDN